MWKILSKKWDTKLRIQKAYLKAVELSYVPLYHAVYSLYGAFFGIFHYPNVYL